MTIKAGYEQFVPPSVPPGMWFDPDSWLILPQGARLASKGRVAASWFLAIGLFAVTLGVGYLAWALVTWDQGQTPAQRLLGLRCWRPESGRLADRKRMALREAAGLLDGEFLIGPILWLTSASLKSLGDLLVGTVVLHDPNHVLHR
jgi:uncharacterized RDD family membrane protein YckC